MNESIAPVHLDLLGGTLWLFFSVGVLVRLVRWFGLIRPNRDGKQHHGKPETHTSRRPASDVPVAALHGRRSRPRSKAGG